MKQLPESLLKQAKRYREMPTEERRKFIETLYNKPYYYSFPAIGELVGETGKKIRKHHPKMVTRTRSESQKLSLKMKRNEHPTKGRKRTEDEKVKISEAVANAWEQSSPEHKEKIAKMGKERWDKKTETEKQEMYKKAGTKLREVASKGSWLEHYLHRKLIESGYVVSVHKKHLIVNEKLEIDLLIFAHKIAIEVDGPSHFRPIWGEESFEGTQKADSMKNALLLTKGYTVIRLRYNASPTQKEARDLFNELLETVKNVVENPPQANQEKLIYIGVTP
jgi:very-short-patch-repair endonuclease